MGCDRCSFFIFYYIKSRSGKIRRFFQTCFVSRDLCHSLIKSVRLANPDYGYRTVTLALKNKGINVNHKAVLRIMRENNLLCQAFNRRTKKYNSYKGTVGTVAHNRLNRRFKMDRPFQKIVTDVTEVRWGNQTINKRAYFTVYIDLYNGEIIE
ncbi:IS3 family transposase [Lactiplantibacillus plantarum]|uniref:IS3 family transposase n=1 Tax=Lactiplantibacillus plantarum TaxID=1590 RepID=UPI003F53AC74